MTPIVFPYHVTWLLTRRCSLRCSHCSADGGWRTEELSLQQVLDVLGQLRSIGVVDIGLSGGEPLLRRDIFEIVSAAVDHGFSVGLGTSGWRVDRAALQKLKRIRRLQISVDGLRTRHDEIRRPGSFDMAVRLARDAIAAGLRVHFCYTPQRRNVDDFEKVAELAAGLGVALLNVSQFVPAGRGTRGDDLSPSEYQAFLRRWVVVRDAYRGELELRSHLAQLVLLDPNVAGHQEFRGCAAGRRQGCITAEGYVTPCVLIPRVLGDLRKSSFGHIWETSPLIRRLQGDRAFGTRCIRCAVAGKCGGCRAAAVAWYGDLFGDDPHCWL